MLSSLTNSFKTHAFSIITALIIAASVGGYLLLILPRQTAKEDLKNRAVFTSIKQQLNDYINDKVKRIDARGIKLEENKFKFNTIAHNEYYADSINIDWATVSKNSLIIKRRIWLKKTSQKINTDTIGSIIDTTVINLNEFRKKIPDMTNFNAFYICQVYPLKKDNDSIFPLLSENVSIRDRDSIWHSRRSNGPLSFKGSSKRYYTDHFTIPGIKTTLLIATGVEQSFFQSAVRAVNPGILILSLSFIVILILSMSFIKPIISSFKERVEQKDLISVVFSIGALSTVVVVFTMVTIWDSVIESKNDKDLYKLSQNINTSFTNQVNTYIKWQIPNLVDYRQNSMFRKIVFLIL